jgi:acyl-CoA dehydrogenase
MVNEANEIRQLILDSAEKIFSSECDKKLLDAAEQGHLAEALFGTLVENGFHQLGAAGSGTDAADLYAFLQVCGRFAVPLPMAGVLLGNQWAGPIDGITSIGAFADDQIVGAPWARDATRVIGVEESTGLLKVADQFEVVAHNVSVASELQNTVRAQDYQTLEIQPHPFAQMALANVNLIAGCLQAQLDLGILFATQRSQFGRTISKFQAIQHSLAVVAAEVAAAKRAADAAVDALGDDRFVSEVAASKARVGEAVTCVAEQVHQVHGAMGFTHEHQLHHFSRRSWAWRDEWGNEFYWQQRLGQKLCDLGADNVWDFIATQS